MSGESILATACRVRQSMINALWAHIHAQSNGYLEFFPRSRRHGPCLNEGMNHEDRTAVAPLLLTLTPSASGEDAVPMPQVRTPHSGVRLTELEEALRARDNDVTKVYAFAVPKAFSAPSAPESATRPFETGRAARPPESEDTAPAFMTHDPFAEAARALAGSVTQHRRDDEDRTRLDVVSPWAHAANETTLCSAGVVRDLAPAPTTERSARNLGLAEPITDVGLPAPMFGWVEAVCDHVLGAALAVARIFGGSAKAR